MRINNCENCVNFNGAYRFQALNNKAYVNLLYITPKDNCKIFHDINAKREVIFACSTAYNSKVRNFIKDNHLNFQYFPKIKLGEKLTETIVGKLIKRDTAQNDVITDLPALNSEVIKDNIINSRSVKKHMDKIFKSLRLNIEKPVISTTADGLPKIRDNVKERTIYLSPNYQNKYYVYIKPDSPNQDSGRYLLSEKGKKILKEYKTPEEIEVFKACSCIVPD